MSIFKIACKKYNFTPGSVWLLNINISGYKNAKGSELATEAAIGRRFEIIEDIKQNAPSLEKKRIQVKLLEDGYICWLEFKDLLDQIEISQYCQPQSLSRSQITKKIPKILAWIKQSSYKPNQYLWGGTVGPNFDCSGLIQTAFSLEQIWLPRDAYQQEKFCQKIEFDVATFDGLLPGDLLFFGDDKRCSHVAIYQGEGSYWHSSGTRNGRNGIGVDTLNPNQQNVVSSFYLSILRGAGRINSCHRGNTII